MREILFRGKRSSDGKWVEGFYYKHESVKVCFASDDPHVKHMIAYDGSCDWGFEPPMQAVEVLPDTVGQYTGLKDRNGVRIFEGDIIDHHVQGDILVNRGVIQWDARCARWSHRLNTMNPELAFFNPGAWEVIGNIHDNPEMAEVKKDD